MADILYSFKQIMAFSDHRLLLSLLGQPYFLQFFGKLHHWQSTLVLFFSIALQDSRTSSLPNFTLPFSPSHGGRGSSQNKFDVEMSVKLFPTPARVNSVRTMLI